MFTGKHLRFSGDLINFILTKFIQKEEIFMEMITNQLIEEALANVNIGIVLGLMAIGFLIKHVSFFEKVENDLIPPILLLSSIVAVILTEGFTIPSIISAVINAAVSVGLHQQGKNIFTVTIVPSLAEFFKSLSVPSTKYTKLEDITFTSKEFVEEVIVEEEETVDEVIVEE